ncbi:MAG: fused DSP-PTPase phosphatase/NAD kinase-like protein [Pannonibacter sp.]
MVKLTPKTKRKAHAPADLSTRAGRARARRELVWGDHGFLRARFSNLHQISPEMWRSNQPSPRQVLAHARERGIRTILNLRGHTTKGYYLLEQEACDAAGIELIDFQVFSRDPPTREAIFAARDLFERIEYPALMHCKSGADRAGVMAVLYKLLRERVPFEEAAEQLSGKYLHVRQGKTGVLDAFIESYAAFNAGRPPGQWKPFLDWAAEDYDRLAVKEAFALKLGRGFQLDALLGRE